MNLILQRAFSNLDTNEGVSPFNKTTLSIAWNFIPHETIICDDRETPWTKTCLTIKNRFREIFGVAKIQKYSNNLS